MKWLGAEFSARISCFNARSLSKALLRSFPLNWRGSGIVNHLWQRVAVVSSPPLVSEAWFTAQVFQCAPNEARPFFWREQKPCLHSQRIEEGIKCLGSPWSQLRQKKYATALSSWPRRVCVAFCRVKLWRADIGRRSLWRLLLGAHGATGFFNQPYDSTTQARPPRHLPRKSAQHNSYPLYICVAHVL
jgi:hypothetical protein